MERIHYQESLSILKASETGDLTLALKYITPAHIAHPSSDTTKTKRYNTNNNASK